MESVKTKLDVHTLLRATVLHNGKVAFRADNGYHKYLSRYTRKGVNNIEAVKPTIDIFSQFTVEVGRTRPWKGVHYIHLRADNGRYIGVRSRGGRYNLEATFGQQAAQTRFVLLEVF